MTAGCFCRGTARHGGINGEGPHRVKIVTTLCRLLCHYLACGADFLATIWPLIEILRSLVSYRGWDRVRRTEKWTDSSMGAHLLHFGGGDIMIMTNYVNTSMLKKARFNWRPG